VTPQPPRWLLVARLLGRAECRDAIRAADDLGWRSGTYADGTERPNVAVCFLGEDDSPPGLYDRIRDISRPAADILGGILIAPNLLDSIQVSRWRQGDHYGHHRDHDPREEFPRADRKLSVYISLSDGGGLDIDGTGLIRANAGDSIIMSSITTHAAPVQGEGERHSVVAWVPGPRWR